MAAKLTPRQQQINDLHKQGKSAAEIADALGITRNAVYQQMKRIGGRGARRSTRGRQSARSTRTLAPQRPRVPEQDGPHKTIADPLTATKDRLAAVKIEHREAEQQRDAALKALDSLDAEVKRLTQAEAVLSGKTTGSQGKRPNARQRPAQRPQRATNGAASSPQAVDDAHRVANDAIEAVEHREAPVETEAAPAA